MRWGEEEEEESSIDPCAFQQRCKKKKSGCVRRDNTSDFK